jgi:hypothetical protein
MTITKTFRKKLPLLLAFSILLFATNKESISQSSPVDISAKIEANNKQNGESPIYKDEGKYTLYASYSQKKLTGLYAINNDGKKIDVTYKKEKDGTGSESCFACINFLGLIICHKISCGQVPPPKKNGQ